MNERRPRKRTRRTPSRAADPKDHDDIARNNLSRAHAATPAFPAAWPVSHAAIWISVALVLLTVSVYFPVRHFGFVAYDDPRYIINNIHVATGLTWQNVRWAFTSVYGPYWHPLTFLSHMADAQLYGLNAGGHHVTNVILHTINALLLFAILCKLTGAIGRSAFVAALFAVHPLHVESVAWVTERLDVLSTMFLLLTIAAYARYVSRPGRGRFALVVGVYAAGLLAKPMLVTLPVILLLLDVWPLGRLGPSTDPARATFDAGRVARLLKEKAVLLVLAIAAGIATIVLEHQRGAVANLHALPLNFRLANALVSCLTYIEKMCWPTGLAAFYPYPQQLPSLWFVLAATALLVSVSALAIRRVRSHPYFFVGWYWFLVTLVPVIGIVQAADQARADRFTYIPLIGLFIVVAWGVPELLKRLSIPTVVWRSAAAAVVVAFALVAHRQVSYWKDSIALWSRAVDVTTDNHRAQASLAEAYRDAGNAHDAIAHFTDAIRVAADVPEYRNGLALALERDGRQAEAMQEYANAIQLMPDYAEARTNFGLALARAGRLNEALTQYDAALRSKPNLAAAHVDRGGTLARQGRTDEAGADYAAALKIDPDLADAHSGLGAIELATGHADQAAGEFAEAVRLDPESAERHTHLATAYARAGRFDQAIGEFRKAIELKPDFAAAHNDLGNVFLGQDRLDDAITEYGQALSLEPTLVQAHNNLGLALAKRGDVDGAIRQFTQVLLLDPANTDAQRSLDYLRAHPRRPPGR